MVYGFRFFGLQGSTVWGFWVCGPDFGHFGICRLIHYNDLGAGVEDFWVFGLRVSHGREAPRGAMANVLQDRLELLLYKLIQPRQVCGQNHSAKRGCR